MIAIATGPASWGVDYVDAPGNPPWPVVLDGIAAAGYGWLELGPVGYLPEDPSVLRVELERRELHAVGTCIFQPLHDRTLLEHVLDLSRRACDLIRAVDGRYFVVVPHTVPERTAVAGNSARARRLAGKEWHSMLSIISAVAEIAYERSLRAVLHPHAGTYIEFADEISAAAERLDAELIALCVDSGHSFYAGVDPAALVKDFGGRVEHIHLKDINADILDLGLSFEAAVAAGVFCPLGQGSVDLKAFHRALIDIGYSGLATVEQDRDPSTPGDPVTDSRASREFLRTIGFVETNEASTA